MNYKSKIKKAHNYREYRILLTIGLRLWDSPHKGENKLAWRRKHDHRCWKRYRDHQYKAI